MKDILTERWNEMWSGLGAYGHAERYLDQVIDRYSEPDRHYHNLPHLTHGFDLIWMLKDTIRMPNPYRIAFGYAGHDIWYDPRTSYYQPGLHINERMSADWTKCVGREIRLDESICQELGQNVMATAHPLVLNSVGECLTADIDLAILGAPEHEYDRYTGQIRQEYWFLSDAEYKNGRKVVMQKFLQRPSIYRTPIFRDLYEQKAQANLARELEFLSSE